MKRVFVFEYLSAGGLIEGDRDGKAAAELMPQGRWMRDALVGDLLQVTDCQVTAAVCTRAPLLLQGARAVKSHPGETVFAFARRQAPSHDAVWVVAPETGGLLAHFRGLVDASRWMGCDAASIAIAASKRATVARLAQQGILTPRAFEYSPETARWVVKPDDGAGAVETRVHASRAAAEADTNARTSASSACTVEPWVEGDAMSLSLICRDGTAELLSVNHQLIQVDDSGELAFNGVDLGVLPLAGERGAALAMLARRVARALPGLRGFVGIDLVWHVERGPVVIEVNPRITSAYPGLSAALGRNLAGELLADHLQEQIRDAA